MRCSFPFNKKIDEDFRKYMTENLKKMGSVIGFGFSESSMDVTFRADEDDIDSVLELAEKKEFYVIENSFEVPFVNRTSILLTCLFFVFSLISRNNLVQTFFALIVFLFSANSVLNCAIDCIVNRRISVALSLSCLSCLCIAYGIYSFLFPKYDLYISLFGILFMGIAQVYYYMCNNKRDGA